MRLPPRLDSKLRALVSPGVRFEVRRSVDIAREVAARSRVWTWECGMLPQAAQKSPQRIVYVGRASERAQTAALLGLESSESEALGAWWGNRAAVVVAEAPFPGAIRVPKYLHIVVRLGRPLDEVIQRYDAELRRRLRKQRPRYTTRQIVDPAEIEHVNRTMLVSYAKDRHGAGAAHVELEVVRRLLSINGRLDVVSCDGEPVACHLGHAATRHGSRYWVTLRFGYPESIFADGKRLREANSMNTYLALEWAVQNNYDYYDMGGCLARPDDGLVQWKRRRAGDVAPLCYVGSLFVGFSPTEGADLLWRNPLFGIDKGSVNLHLGFPEGRTVEEALSRYREFVFGGLSTAFIYCQRVPPDAFMNEFRQIFARSTTAPELRLIPAG